MYVNVCHFCGERKKELSVVFLGSVAHCFSLKAVHHKLKYFLATGM